ncbi:hypothetical protein B0H19DRAFT_1253814 [Mycena capillaripes]|nr:hypothetical protein B0H19DRAFT_1253814 [Mycena capillaripes]
MLVQLAISLRQKSRLTPIYVDVDAESGPTPWRAQIEEQMLWIWIPPPSSVAYSSALLNENDPWNKFDEFQDVNNPVLINEIIERLDDMVGPDEAATLWDVNRQKSRPRFDGFWPAHDMIAGYLLNAQMRRRRDLWLEKEAEAGNSDDAAEDDGLAERSAAENDKDDLDAAEDDNDPAENDKAGDSDNTMFPPSVRTVLFRIESESGEQSGPSQSNSKARGKKDGTKGDKVKPKTTGKRKAKEPVEEPQLKKPNAEKKTAGKRKAKEPVEE